MLILWCSVKTFRKFRVCVHERMKSCFKSKDWLMRVFNFQLDISSVIYLVLANASVHVHINYRVRRINLSIDNVDDSICIAQWAVKWSWDSSWEGEEERNCGGFESQKDCVLISKFSWRNRLLVNVYMDTSAIMLLKIKYS